MADAEPTSSMEKRLQDQHDELLQHLDAWFEKIDTSISHLSTQPMKMYRSSEYSYRPSGASSKQHEDRDQHDENVAAQELWGRADTDRSAMRALPTGELRNSRTAMKRLDSYHVAVMKSNRIAEAFRRIWSKDGSGSSMTPHQHQKQSAWGRWKLSLREYCANIIHSQAATIFFAVTILTNSMFLGIQLEWRSQHPGNTDAEFFFAALHTTYAVLFTVEVLLSLIADGWCGYFFSNSWTWNWLDVFVVLSSWTELLLEFLQPTGSRSISNSNLRLVRVLRVGRLLRVLRVLRVARVFKALRTLVHSLVDTTKQLIWAMLLLALIMYMFSIMFTDIVLEHVAETASPGEPEATMEEYFGTLYRSFSTLFRALLNGFSWYEAADALLPLNMYWVQMFHFYIAFCQFAVLNVMTGVFCNSAIKAAEKDHDLVVQSLLQNRQEFRALVNDLFYRIDERGLGKITLTDLEKNLGDDTVKAFFESLELGAVDAWTLFLSLDVDGDSLISIDEFMERCFSLRGPARSVDLYALRRQNVKLREQLHQVEDLQQQIMAHFNASWHYHSARSGAEIKDTVSM